MSKKTVLIIAVIILVIIIISIAVFYLLPEKDETEKTINVLTDKEEYASGETLKVKIENSTEDRICFSSCYPYYLQKKNGNKQWKDYQYEDCNNDDVVENCIEPKEVKAYEIVVPDIDEGEHRLLINACVGCNLRQRFEKHKNLISNYFIVK